MVSQLCTLSSKFLIGAKRLNVLLTAIGEIPYAA